jgi:PPOX class probable F420-dependent enzyme
VLRVPSFSPAGFESLLDGPSPAVLTTYRRDGSALVSPVWFQYRDEGFEVVIAAGDVKLRHVERDPRVVLVIFEATAPFRGIEVRGVPELLGADATEARARIASRYLGHEAGARFVEQRASKPGVVLRLAAGAVRSWDLRGILPD